MALNYLIFDHTEFDDGGGSFDAMASATAAGWPALQAELVTVLGWAHRQFPDGPGALDDGCDWDCDLQATQERCRRQHLHFDPASGALQARDSAEPELLRHAVSLCLSGTPAFCTAFAERFVHDAPGGAG
jgi:hypothetical protein